MPSRLGIAEAVAKLRRRTHRKCISMPAVYSLAPGGNVLIPWV
jgi:hypothetical protein